MTTLTLSQEKAICEYELFLANPKTKYFHLKGAAGRGKSWLFANELYNLYYNSATALCSTTNQGVKSFTELFPKPFSHEVRTVHSTIGLVPSSKKNMEYSHKLNDDVFYEVDLKCYSVKKLVIIDEAYRLDSLLIKFLDISFPKAKFVFIYDPYQTKPIKSNGWTIESLEDSVHVELVEPTRFEITSDLNEFVDNLHLAVKFNETNYKDLIPTYNSPTISKVNKTSLLPLVNSYLENTNFDNQSHLILSGTRKQTDAIHSYIVKNRVKNKLPFLHKHDEVTIEYSIGLDCRQFLEIEFMNKYGMSGYTAKPDKLIEYSIAESPAAKLKLPCFTYMGLVRTMPIQMVNRKDKYIYIYLRTGHKGKPLTKKDLNTLWQYYNQTGNLVVILNLNIVKTIHSAQGITTDNAYLLTDSIESWGSLDDILRLYYTGSSRASKHLYLVSN